MRTTLWPVVVFTLFSISPHGSSLRSAIQGTVCAKEGMTVVSFHVKLWIGAVSGCTISRKPFPWGDMSRQYCVSFRELFRVGADT
jgi:hypothetical protein